MKKLLLFSVLWLFAGVFAFSQQTVNASFQVIFEPGAIGTQPVDHVVEQLLPGGTWVEKAVGPTSPIAWAEQVEPGSLVTVRVYVRLRAKPEVRSKPSNETSAYVGLGAPRVITFTIATSSTNEGSATNR